MEIQLGNTDYAIPFLLVSSGDSRTGLEGASPAVTISKNGGGFGSASGAVTEVGNGVYWLAASEDDADTLGPMVIHVEAEGADPLDLFVTVVRYDPVSSVNSIETKISGIGRVVEYVGPVAPGGEVTLYRGYANASAHGTALQWSSTSWPALAGATVELRDKSGAIGTASVGTVHLQGGGLQQVATVEIDDAETEGLETGRRTYTLVATFTDGDPIALARGLLVVLDE